MQLCCFVAGGIYYRHWDYFHVCRSVLAHVSALIIARAKSHATFIPLSCQYENTCELVRNRFDPLLRAYCEAVPRTAHLDSAAQMRLRIQEGACKEVGLDSWRVSRLLLPMV